MKTVGGGCRTFPCPSWKKQVQSFPLSYAYGWATVEKRMVGKHQRADALVDTVKIIDSFRESAMQISAACEKRAVLFRLSCSLLLAVRKAVSPTAKARFNSGRECHPAAMFCFLP